MIDASIRLAILAAAVELATRRMRRSSPAAAHALWMLVVLAAAVLPAIEWLLEPVGFVHPAGRLAAVFPSRQSIDGWGPVLFAVYAAGASVALLQFAVGIVMIRSLVRRAVPIDEARLVPSPGRAPARGGRVRVYETSSLAVPVTTGFLRPRILLPADWGTWPEERLRAVLRHELAHVRRADYASGLASAAVLAVFWFHPAAWLARRRVSLCAELACDRTAAAGDDDYASHLLSLAARSAPPLRYRWSVGATTSLAERIDALLAPEQRRLMRVLGSTVLCVALLSCLLAAARFRIVPAVRAQSTMPFASAGEAHHSHAHGH